MLEKTQHPTSAMILFVVDRQVQQGPHTVWIDNFSKIYALHTPTLDLGSWQNCAWTGKALRKCNDQTISMKVMTHHGGSIIPAMPRNPFKLRRELEELYLEIAEAPGASMQHATCIVTMAKVKSVPLKPKPKHIASAVHKEALTERCNRLIEMYPVGLLDQNIGANNGLLRIMRTHYLDENQHLDGVCQRYTAFNVDTNIFDRMLKVTSHAIACT
jgi:hypothetical protein